MNDMKVTMLLCDAVQVAEGKLFILGAGWSVKAPFSPMAVALKIDVPWSQTNIIQTWRLFLVDEDGNPVIVETAEGDQTVELESQFEVGRPPGLPEGTPIDFPVAINFPSVPLPPGRPFEWRLEINGKTEEDWFVTFRTMT